MTVKQIEDSKYNTKLQIVFSMFREVKPSAEFQIMLTII